VKLTTVPQELTDANDHILMKSIFVNITDQMLKFKPQSSEEKEQVSHSDLAQLAKDGGVPKDLVDFKLTQE
jgi:hypothetical protein